MFAFLGNWGGRERVSTVFAMRKAPVDPYPESYTKLAEYAANGKALVGALLGATSAGGYVGNDFDKLLTMATRLQDMTVYQRTGAPCRCGTQPDVPWAADLVER